jgi:ribosomal-protein-alanine N-acetyltransferase
LEKEKRSTAGDCGETLIRPFERKDLKDVYKIIEETFFRPWSIEEILLENIFSYKIVLDIDGKVVGFLFGEIIFEEGNILMIAVDKRFQGKGFGKKLLNHFIKEAKEKKVRKVFLEVSVKNEPAIQLYKKSGFKVQSVRKRYYRNGDDAYMMMLEI